MGEDLRFNGVNPAMFEAEDELGFFFTAKFDGTLHITDFGFSDHAAEHGDDEVDPDNLDVYQIEDLILKLFQIQQHAHELETFRAAWLSPVSTVQLLIDRLSPAEKATLKVTP